MGSQTTHRPRSGCPVPPRFLPISLFFSVPPLSSLSLSLPPSRRGETAAIVGMAVRGNHAAASRSSPHRSSACCRSEPRAFCSRCIVSASRAQRCVEPPAASSVGHACRELPWPSTPTVAAASLALISAKNVLAPAAPRQVQLPRPIPDLQRCPTPQHPGLPC